jgi:hypothetical protein
MDSGILHPKRYKEPATRVRDAARTAAAAGPALTGPTADRPPCYAAWNCSASVEPDRATVSAFGEIAEVTRSKYPVPTSRWWRVAV